MSNWATALRTVLPLSWPQRDSFFARHGEIDLAAGDQGEHAVRTNVRQLVKGGPFAIVRPVRHAAHGGLARGRTLSFDRLRSCSGRARTGLKGEFETPTTASSRPNWSTTRAITCFRPSAPSAVSGRHGHCRRQTQLKSSIKIPADGADGRFHCSARRRAQPDDPDSGVANTIERNLNPQRPKRGLGAVRTAARRWPRNRRSAVWRIRRQRAKRRGSARPSSTRSARR